MTSRQFPSADRFPGSGVSLTPAARSAPRAVRTTMSCFPVPVLGIIAQLFPRGLCSMHKAPFFHFLHKRAKSSFLGFGQFAQFFEPKRSFIHNVLDYTKFSLCFLLNFCLFSSFFCLENLQTFALVATKAHILPVFPALFSHCRPFMVNAIRFLATSTDKTFTLTISPTFRTSRGCLMKRSLICDICTSPS